MSGLEVLGALSGSAQLLELTAKSLTKLGFLIKRIRDGEAVKTVTDLCGQFNLFHATAQSVHEVLSSQAELFKGAATPAISPPELRIWVKIEATSIECCRRLQEFDVILEPLVETDDAQPSFVDKAKVEFKLHLKLPTITRLKDDLSTYIDTITLLIDLAQTLSQQRDSSHNRELLRVQQTKLSVIDYKIEQLGKDLRRRQTGQYASQSLQSEDIEAVGPADEKALKSHVSDVLTIARTVKASLYSPDQGSVASRSLNGDFTPASGRSVNVLSPTPSHIDIPQLSPFRLQQIESSRAENAPPEATHREPLEELAKQFKRQADADFDQDHFQAAEYHLKEAIKLFSELHDCYDVPFEAYSSMMLQLAEIYAKQDKFDEADHIWDSGQDGDVFYIPAQDKKVVAPDMTAEKSRDTARWNYSAANGRLLKYEASRDQVHLAQAESRAKKAFRLQRDTARTNAVDSEFQQTVRLLVEIYRRQIDKGIYAKTYSRMYLPGSGSGGEEMLIKQDTRYSSSTDTRSQSVCGSTHGDLIDMVKRHQLVDIDQFRSTVDLDELQDGKSAMMQALDCKFEECTNCQSTIDQLLRAGAERNAPFAYAVANGQIENCHLLLKNDAKIDHFDAEGLTPLMRAVRLELSKMVTFLVKNSANVNIKAGEQEQTALHLAVEKGNTDILRSLLNDGALAESPCIVDIDCQDKRGFTALHMSAWRNNVDLAIQLLRSNANPNVEDFTSKRRTALYLAVYDQNIDMVEALVNGKADINKSKLPMQNATRDVKLCLDREVQRRTSLSPTTADSQRRPSTPPKRRSRQDSIFAKFGFGGRKPGDAG